MKVPLSAPDGTLAPENTVFKVPYFHTNNVSYVLVSSLVSLWNFPSSYQLINRLVKHTGTAKNDFLLVSDPTINDALLKKGLLDKKLAGVRLFYVKLDFLYLVLVNKDDLVVEDVSIVPPAPPVFPPGYRDPTDDKITVNQVFPNYGMVESSLELNHTTFNTLTHLTKLNYYKLQGNIRRFLGNALSLPERELLYKEYSYADAPLDEDSMEEDAPSRRSRKPIGKPRKHVVSIDPNTIDLAELILPGQGFIPEFNVNHICKVPNYYITSSSASVPSYGPRASSRSAYNFNENIKLSRNLQQLVTNDNDAHNSRYYYTKVYRGPGSGNYKDAALVNKINKIHTVPGAHPLRAIHKTHQRVFKPHSGRHNANVKGLLFDHFNKENVELALDHQRQFTEDFHNIEMLHNNLQYNTLVNSYREIAADTWRSYYKFKMIDFEQLSQVQKTKAKEAKKRELIEKHQKLQREKGVPLSTASVYSDELTEIFKLDLSAKYTLPTAFKEVVEKLPMELRSFILINGNGQDLDVDIPAIKVPVYYSTLYSDLPNPEYMNKLDIVKLPNANAIAWDNFRKYREN